MHRASIAACIIVAAISQPAGAAAVYNFVDDGGNVVGTLSRSIDLTGLVGTGGLRSGTLTFSGRDNASLGILAGYYVSVLTNQDTITLSFDAAVIPLPASLPLVVGALVALGAFRRLGGG